MDSAKVTKRAQAMAAKDGQDWDSLDEVYHNAYIHNAEVAIATENPGKESDIFFGKDPGPEPKVTGDDACTACDGMGDVPDKAANLRTQCYVCKGSGYKPGREAAIEDDQEDDEDIVIAAVAEMEPNEPPAPSEPIMPPEGLVLKTDQYWCTKCGICHYATKKIGVRHLKHKAPA